GVNTATGRLFISTVGVHLLPVATARTGLAAEVPTRFRFRYSGIHFRRQCRFWGAQAQKKARSVASGPANRGGLFPLLQHVRGIIARVWTSDAWGGIHIGANRVGCLAGRASRHRV